MNSMENDRAGRYIKQLSGYKAYVPNPLPPDPPIHFDTELQQLLSEADRMLARLDGTASVLPNPDLFIAMYVKKEALLSSQIEGTQASLEGILEFESDLIPNLRMSENLYQFALKNKIKRFIASRSLPVLRKNRSQNRILS